MKLDKVLGSFLTGILFFGFANLNFYFVSSTKDQIAKEMQKIKDKGKWKVKFDRL